MNNNISFVIPVFNSGPFLHDALQSILEQIPDGIEIEIVIVDDMSTDLTTIKILECVASWDHVLVIRSSQNGGPAKARNAGIRAASGRWIGFLDADDLLAPGTIKNRIEMMAAHPESRWLAGDILEIRAPGKMVHEAHFDTIKTQGTLIAPNTYVMRRPVNHMLDWDVLPVLGAMIIRRDVFDEIGLLGENLIYGEDIHFCLLLANCYDLYWFDQPGLYLRRYHESMTKDTFRGSCAMPDASRLLLRDQTLRPYRKKLKWMHAANLRLRSSAHRQRGNRKLALWSALEALWWTPNDMRNVKAIFSSFTA